MMLNEEIKDDETYQIIGAAMKVQSALGNGFQEVIYQRALIIELKKTDLNFEREVEMPIFYDDQQIGTRRADFVINQNVVVEIKAVTQLDDTHLAQGLNYLTAYNLDKGLLLNFGGASLEVKRLRHPRNKNANPNLNLDLLD